MREAYDLFSPACREHFKKNFKRNWKYMSFWRMVVGDTLKRVCSQPYMPATRGCPKCGWECSYSEDGEYRMFQEGSLIGNIARHKHGRDFTINEVWDCPKCGTEFMSKPRRKGQ